MKIGIEGNLLRRLLKNAYFINGTAYAGKSTMVKLLSEKYDGICCGENYHDALRGLADPAHQPNLCYFETMRDWQEFVSRTPEEYDAWITGCAEEAAELELIALIRLSAQDRPIFVDTNIPPAMLREIAEPDHVAFMLCPQRMSVGRFFDRPDPEKQFLYQQLQQAPDPARAMENYRRCLERVNSAEHYRAFAESGFFTYVREERSTLEEALSALERHFCLTK